MNPLATGAAPCPQPALLFSVVIPAYNYAATLPRAVHSVVGQLGDRDELIVIDDGSTDTTPAVITSLRAATPSSVRFIRKENGGLSSVRNRGIREARGAYLIFLDADDELLPGALARLAEHVAANPTTRLVVGGHVSAWENGKRREHLPDELPSEPLARVRGYLIEKRIVLSNGACAMHRDVFTPGDYPESFRSAEDIPVFAQTLANFPCTTLRVPLVQIYKHDDSLRHQFEHAKNGGLRLVDEVFSPQRLGPVFAALKAPYRVQRSLSLFRSAYLAGDYAAAKAFFIGALKTDWRVVLRPEYARKALRVWLS